MVIQWHVSSIVLLDGNSAIYDIPKLYTMQSKGNTMTTITLTPSVDALINEYGSVHAEITRLTKIKESLSKDIKALGAGRYETPIYSGLVFPVSGKETIDWNTVAIRFCEINNIDFKPSAQLVSAHTKRTEDSLSLRVTKV